VIWCVYLAVYWLVSSPTERSQEKEGSFVSEADEKSSAGWNSGANHPTGLGTERVQEEVEQAGALSVELQWGEVDALSKQVCWKGGAKPQH